MRLRCLSRWRALLGVVALCRIAACQAYDRDVYRASLDAAAAVPSCESLPALGAPPVIDGVLEGGLALVPIAPQGWTNSHRPIPADVTASYAAAWRPDGLYLFVSVRGNVRHPAPAADAPWCGDGVEIYADSDGVFNSPPELMRLLFFIIFFIVIGLSV